MGFGRRFGIARSGNGRHVVSGALLLCVLPGPALALDDCRFSGQERVIVSNVLSGDSLVLGGDRHVRLINAGGISLSVSDLASKDREIALRAKKVLEKLVLGKMVFVRYGGRRKDRYGRELAHIFTGDQAKTWVQAHMIERGLARVYSFKDNHTCVARLLDMETKARGRRLGIWAMPDYSVKRADKPQSLGRLANSFQIVEGRVFQVARVSGRTFINFEKDWKRDFTIMISRRDLKRFTKVNVDPLTLGGKMIRVRGWLTLNNGPSIQATHPQQVEIMTGKALLKQRP